ncbi:MAG: sporulation protein YtxC [Clostridiaceae bacterium]|nr:putative sporulation protein YtxC [Eubacteriales bacterium]
MAVRTVGTYEYDADISRLVRRRLKKLSSSLTLREGSGKRTAEAQIETDTEADAWCEAVAEVLLYDVAHFELARLVNDLPISLEQKRLALPEAIKSARGVGTMQTLKREIAAHYEENDALVLEGYVRFRMKEVQKAWEFTVIRAVEELLIKNEYLELMNVLSAFVQLQPPRIKDVSVILNPDGSCTLTDDMNSRVDYEKCTGDGVVSILVGLAPERITVYDLSGGKSTMLAEILIRVFEDRVRFFK